MGTAGTHVADDEDEDDEEDADDAEDDDQRQRQHLPLALPSVRILQAGHLAALMTGSGAGSYSALWLGRGASPCRRSADVREDHLYVVRAFVSRDASLAAPPYRFVSLVVLVVGVALMLGVVVQGLQEVVEVLTPLGVALASVPAPQDPSASSSSTLVGQGKVPHLQARPRGLVELVELEERSAQRVGVFRARPSDDLILRARAALQTGVSVATQVVAVRTSRQAAAADCRQRGQGHRHLPPSCGRHAASSRALVVTPTVVTQSHI